MQVVALGYLVYQRTGSTTAVAVVAAADGVPSVILSLAGGVLADRLPRRRILLVTQSLLGFSAGTLAVLVATNHATFVAILVVAIVFGATDAADLPTRQALVADLVDRHLVVNAVALGATAMSATRIVGPSVAGLLIGFAGPAVCFGFLVDRLSRADRRAPDGHPRRGAAATSSRDHRAGGARRRAPRRRCRPARSRRGDRCLGARVLRCLLHAVSASSGENATACRTRGARHHVQRGWCRRARRRAGDRFHGSGGRTTATHARGRDRVRGEPLRRGARHSSLDHASCAGGHQLRVRGREHVDDHDAADGYRPGAARAAARYLRDHLCGIAAFGHGHVRIDPALGRAVQCGRRRCAPRRGDHGCAGGRRRRSERESAG